MLLTVQGKRCKTPEQTAGLLRAAHGDVRVTVHRTDGGKLDSYRLSEDSRKDVRKHQGTTFGGAARSKPAKAKTGLQPALQLPKPEQTPLSSSPVAASMIDVTITPRD